MLDNDYQLICYCNQITLKDVIQYKEMGITDIEKLQEFIKIADTCYGCENCVLEILNDK